jgi:predicted dehydrogenase
MLRVGLIGLGHGNTLLQANLPNNQDIQMQVTALCDINESKLSKTAKHHNITTITTNYKQLVRRKDVDVVGIYSPGPVHANQILDALDAGKHVMVTKSMAYSMEESERIVEAVDKTGLILLVTQTMRGDAKHMETKRLCDAGMIGDLILAESTYIHDLRPVYIDTPWRIQMPQDLLLGGACHPIDALRWFMGDVEEVHCYGIRGNVATDYPQEDNFVINMKFNNGKIGRVAALCGIVRPPNLPMNGLNIFGTKGSIVDGTAHLDPCDNIPMRKYDISFPNTDRGHNAEMIVMMKHMVDCVTNGTKPWIGAREGAKVVSTGLACWESIRNGKSIKVRNDF